MAIYVCADLHLNHPEVVSNCREIFRSSQDHDKYIIDRYNSVVGKDDLVYILGDVGFKPIEALKKLIRQLNGRKILIIGNHDQLDDNTYRNMGFIEIYRHPVYYSENIILSHIPLKEGFNNPWVINIHGHLHQSNLNLENYFNVNVEKTNYLPINIEVFKEKAQKICKQERYEPFQKEWYSKWENKND